MKVTHSLISSLIVASTFVGVAIATVNQSAHQSASEAQSTESATPLPTITSPLTINGIGPVRVGMTLVQAEQAAGIPFSVPDLGDNGCGYSKPQGIENLLFMVRGNQIARIDVVRNSTIKTLNGAGIGDTRGKIEAMYPRLIKVTPHKYVQGGHYLTYIPPKVSDRKYSIVFETNENDVVTRFRSGKLPEVTWVEGCF
ncbi:MAG: hypothetical protein KME21_29475 [Desmonostoc vinosum HA7617-LM4]|jgi:hypothetical protein|nr:hypothetical protein [Desmonostoc vinosum HA7617-LM4]